jgi:hypothetical protein
MKCDSKASLLARTFVSPCLGCKPKVKLATPSPTMVARHKALNFFHPTFLSSLELSLFFQNARGGLDANSSM